jgi:hypothetical protein
VKGIELHYIYTHEDSIVKLTRHCLKKESKWKYNGEGELTQVPLEVCMELSQNEIPSYF